MNKIALFQIAYNHYVNNSLYVDGVLGENTLSAISNFKKKIIDEVGSIFDGFFIFRISNKFQNTANDLAVYVRNNEIMLLQCNTLAGDYYVYNPISYGGITGTAILKEGLYPKTWEGRLTYRFFQSLPELVQVRPVSVYRDGNKDKEIDRESTQVGIFGINIHQQGYQFIVDNWSAGCITFPRLEWETWCMSHFYINKNYDLYLIDIWSKR